jgi:hypothetical protein
MVRPLHLMDTHTNQTKREVTQKTERLPMTGAQQLQENIGKHGLLSIPNSVLKFTVLILDARSRYGHLDYKVTPLAGEGETWHASTSLRILDTTN